MAETDWIELAGSLDGATLARGVTAGTVKPNSAGVNNFVFGWNSLLSTQGVHGLFVAQTNFNPLKNDALNATGGSIRGAVKRGVSGGATQTGFAPMLFINLGGPSTDDVGYLLGLEDSEPHRIVLRKAAPSAGFGATGALRISSEAFNADTWLHLRLDAIFNANGDVVLKMFKSDLAVQDVEAPDWQPIPGMADFIDDTLGVNTGSVPLSGGQVGFAFFTKDLQKRAYVDHVEILRQK
jgi:hypothetical protein